MKIKILIFFNIILVNIVLSASSLVAMSLGAYITGVKGTCDWTYDYDFSSTGATSINSDVSKIGGGFLLDTGVAYDSLFNYRLNVGYTKMKIDNNNAPDIEGMDFHVYNNFCFGIIRNEYVKVWLAPQIGIGITTGEYNVNNDNRYNNFSTIFASAGLAAGLNVHLNDLFSIGLDCGYRISKHTGTGDYGNYSFNVTGNGKEFFSNVSVMYRKNDFFSIH